MTSPDRKYFRDTELLYSESARCRCGAGLAHPLSTEEAMAIAAWVCSAVLKGDVDGTATRAVPFGSKLEDAATVHDAFDWAFFKIREETSINGSGSTTRPAGTVARTVGNATCPKCGHKWQSEPYCAAETGRHWQPGDCPGCGYGVGGHGVYRSDEGPSIDARYPDVVLVQP